MTHRDTPPVGAMHPATKVATRKPFASDDPSRLTSGDTGGASPLPHDPLPDGFKMTELGPLPEGWDVVRLGDLARVRYGKARPRSAGTVPVIGSGDIYAWTAEPLIDFSTLVMGELEAVQ